MKNRIDIKRLYGIVIDQKNIVCDQYLSYNQLDKLFEKYGKTKSGLDYFWPLIEKYKNTIQFLFRLLQKDCIYFENKSYFILIATSKDIAENLIQTKFNINIDKYRS